ncbi:MAG: LamG-like jellyroll fold domain-containing protein [bacterium]
MKASFSITFTLLAAVLGMAVPGVGHAANLLVNPGFEVGSTGGWTPSWNSDVFLYGGNTVPPRTGAGCLIARMPSVDPYSGYTRQLDQFMPAAPGQVFDASVYVKASGVENSWARMEIVFLKSDKATQLANYPSMSVTADQAFQKVAVGNATAPAGTAWVSVRITVGASSGTRSNPDTFVFDDFELVGKLSDADRSYLRSLALDTWNCIAALAHPVTGLPYDHDGKPVKTSVSNIGFYLTDIVAAYDLGFINYAEAVKRLTATMSGIKKMGGGSDGFHACWNYVADPASYPGDLTASILDSAHLAAGLIVVGQAFPQFKADCDAIVNAMKWEQYYNTSTKRLYGGTTASHVINTSWILSDLAADTRLAYFLAMALDRIPPDSWNTLNRTEETLYGLKYFKPGWASGLFMPYVSSLWMNEVGTEVAESAARFAQAQITRQALNNYPAWGWSPCAVPSGYLGIGQLVDTVVTPHASALALADLPVRVIGNLRALEKDLRFKSYPLHGFYDSVVYNSTFTVGQPTAKYLALDQSMIFLSIANYLNPTNTRMRFAASTVGANGYRRVPGYTGQNGTPDLLAHWRFDEQSGTTAADSSGNGNVGTLKFYSVWAAGKQGGGLCLPGSAEGCVDVPVNSSFAYEHGLTIDAWVKMDAVQEAFRGAPFGIVSKIRAPAEYDFRLYYQTGSQEIILELGGTSVGSVGTGKDSVLTGMWCHVTATYDGSTARIYLNGEERAVKAGTGKVSNIGSSVRMGVSGMANAQP